MSSFKKWHDDADMPTKDANGWYDAETGIAYAATKTTKAAKITVSSETEQYRAYAKALGGKALTGTAKQKEWAESIRRKKLSEMTDTQARLLVNASSKDFCAAKFWIENRDVAASEIAAVATQAAELVASARNVTTERYAQIVAQARVLQKRLKAFSIV